MSVVLCNHGDWLRPEEAFLEKCFIGNKLPLREP